MTRRAVDTASWITPWRCSVPFHPSDCYGFKAGPGIAHRLINRSEEDVTYLEVGDRTEGDEVEYPYDDLKATQLPNGEWALTHKDGRAY